MYRKPSKDLVLAYLYMEQARAMAEEESRMNNDPIERAPRPPITEEVVESTIEPLNFNDGLALGVVLLSALNHVCATLLNFDVIGQFGHEVSVIFSTVALISLLSVVFTCNRYLKRSRRFAEREVSQTPY